MAQESDKFRDAVEPDQLANNNAGNASSNSWSFKFNAAAPEFVPRSYGTQAQAQAQMPVACYFYPCFQYVDGNSGNWIYIADQETTFPLVDPKLSANGSLPHSPKQNSKDVALTDEIKQKIIKQAEYMFSDMSMLANESFAKHVSKDPDGFVPINFVSTTKKLKSLNVTNQMVAQALRSSLKLVISIDGKKVRRKFPFTDKAKEELQGRTVIVENLPDDHSHQNIEKLFNVVGSIKSIRVCQPQDPNSARSAKGDLVVSNKLHALIEYENSETADKAAEKLNDERNWRKGMRVRVMLKRNPKPLSLKSRKSDFDGYYDDEVPQLQEDASKANSVDSAEGDENAGALKRSWSRNRGKPKQRPQISCNLTTPSSISSLGDLSARQTPKGPRMPDGTRGFTMGRGKPLCVPVQSC